MTSHGTVTLSLWRDYKDEARRLPGMHLGTVAVTGDGPGSAREFYRSGVRRAELVTVADLSSDAEPASVVRILDLVRELTAWGIVVDWRVRLIDAPACWPMLAHLYPPREVDGLVGADRLRSDWADGFFLGKCQYRKGPGFLEIRDHRAGVLNRIIIDEPDYIAAVDAIRDTAEARGVPAAVMADLVAESLVLRVGDLHWWAPYRPRRWAQPPFYV